MAKLIQDEDFRRFVCAASRNLRIPLCDTPRCSPLNGYRYFWGKICRPVSGQILLFLHALLATLFFSYLLACHALCCHFPVLPYFSFTSLTLCRYFLSGHLPVWLFFEVFLLVWGCKICLGFSDCVQWVVEATGIMMMFRGLLVFLCRVD